MNDIISYEQVEKRVFELRGEKVLLDSDVAELYGVETKRINEAVKNNLDKFPEGYILSLSSDEWTNLKSKISTSNKQLPLKSQIATLNEQLSLRSKFSTLNESNSLRSKILTLNNNGRGQHPKYLPKAFTEKGLYMLATILKSPAATQTTIAIVETFAKLRELNSIIEHLPDIQDENQQRALAQRSGELVAAIFDIDTYNAVSDEISVEVDLPVLKVKRTVKREKRKDSDTEKEEASNV